jgi:hypothetical protein
MPSTLDLLGSVSRRRQRIINLENFILSHVPYGEVDKDHHLQRGLVQFDGSIGLAGGDTKRPILQWHFGGLPYPITTGLRMEYSYSSWDGGGLTINASILIGFQRGFQQGSVKCTPQIQRNGRSTEAWATAGQMLNAITSRSAKGAANEPTTPDASELETIKKAVQELLKAQASYDPLQSALSTQPTSVLRAGTGMFATLDDLVASVDAEVDWDRVKGNDLEIDFDGPAQDHDSHQPFAYTAATLFADQEKYEQLLWWYFAGKAQRVTKAMRIPLKSSGTDDWESLLIGFTGPGTCPSGC